MNWRVLIICLVLGWAAAALFSDPPPTAERATDSAKSASAGPKFGRLLDAGSGGKMWSGYDDPVFKLARSDDAKGDWPVTKSEVYIGCVPQAGPFSTIVVVDGKPYALNGLTKGWAKRGFVLEIDGKPVPVSSEDFPEWWRRGEMTPRVGLTPLFDAAQAQGCLDIKSVAAN